LPGDEEKVKLTEAGSFLRRSRRSVPVAIGDSARTATRTYSRSRMLSGVKSL
jgi:hypothetical protein